MGYFLVPSQDEYDRKSPQEKDQFVKDYFNFIEEIQKTSNLTFSGVNKLIDQDEKDLTYSVMCNDISQESESKFIDYITENAFADMFSRTPKDFNPNALCVKPCQCVKNLKIIGHGGHIDHQGREYVYM